MLCFLLCCYLCLLLFGIFFFKQKTAYEMRISDWSSDVCSSDLRVAGSCPLWRGIASVLQGSGAACVGVHLLLQGGRVAAGQGGLRKGLLRGQIGRASCRERACQYV